MNILSLIGRDKELFDRDVAGYEQQLRQIVEGSAFLVIGGAGSIGQALSREIFKRNPRTFHISGALYKQHGGPAYLPEDVRRCLGG